MISPQLTKEISVSFLDEDYICLQIFFQGKDDVQNKIIVPISQAKPLMKAIKQSTKDAYRHGKKKERMEIQNFNVSARADGKVALEFSSDLDLSAMELKLIATPELADRLCRTVYEVLNELQPDKSE